MPSKKYTLNIKVMQKYMYYYYYDYYYYIHVCTCIIHLYTNYRGDRYNKKYQNTSLVQDFK